MADLKRTRIVVSITNPIAAFMAIFGRADDEPSNFGAWISGSTAALNPQQCRDLGNSLLEAADKLERGKHMLREHTVGSNYMVVPDNAASEDGNRS